MKHITTTAPTFWPVTVDECREQMGIGNPGDNSRDIIIQARIKAVTLWFENITRTKIVQQTITAYDSKFPCGFSAINLVGPLQSVITVSYKGMDINGIPDAEIELVNTEYLVSIINNRITPSFGKTWPTEIREQDESVRITYTSGYASANLVPVEIKEAIKFTVGTYENYQPTIESGVRPQTVPFAALQLVQQYMDYREWF